MRKPLPLFAFLVFPAVLAAGPIGGFTQTNLVSDIPGLAATTDSSLMNPGVFPLARRVLSGFRITAPGLRRSIARLA
jgi:hypothetical protein